MQINRLFEIVYLLLYKESVTSNELAVRFEVSVRTIYRDIDALSAAGIPVYTSQGKKGGIAILPDYVLNKSVLSESEQNEILYALQSLAAAQNPETSQILARLSVFFHKNSANWIEVDFSPWGSDAHEKKEFAILKDAILDKRIIEFDYYSASGGKSHRRIEPIKLIFKVNAWYVKGFCLSRNKFRSYKITRITNLVSNSEHFKNRPELPDDMQQASPQNQMNVKLRFSSSMAYRVYEEFRESEITTDQEGNFIVSTILPDNDWLTGYLLSFGESAEVISPLHLREKVLLRIEKMHHRYKNDVNLT